MLYADPAGVVSKSAEQLRKIMGVIVVVCAAFGLLPYRRSKTEIVCLRTKGMPEAAVVLNEEIPESTAMLSVEAAGQMYNQTNEFASLTRNVTITPTFPSRSTGAYATLGAASGSTPSNCTADRTLPSSSKSRC